MTVVKGRRRRGVTRISSKNQVTIPVEVLRRAGLDAGREVRIDAEGARIVLQPADDPIQRYAGTFGYPKGYLKRLRREWRG